MEITIEHLIVLAFFFAVTYGSFALFRNTRGFKKFLAGLLLTAVTVNLFRFGKIDIAILWFLALGLAYRRKFISFFWEISDLAETIHFFLQDNFGSFFKFSPNKATDSGNEGQDDHTQDRVREAEEEARKAHEEAAQARQESKNAHERARRAEERARENSKTSNKQSPPPDNRTAYDILGVKPGASQKEIKKAFYSMRNKFHPDKNPSVPDDLRGDMAEEFKRIVAAYERLK